MVYQPLSRNTLLELDKRIAAKGGYFLLILGVVCMTIAFLSLPAANPIFIPLGILYLIAGSNGIYISKKPKRFPIYLYFGLLILLTL